MVNSAAIHLPLSQWLALHLAGFTVRQWLACCDTLQGDIDWLFSPKRLLSDILACGVRQPTAQRWCEYVRGAGKIPKQIADTLAWEQAKDFHHLIAYGDDRYPPLLRESNSPPLLLYVCGDASCVTEPAIGMVGARHATPQGIENVRWFAQHCARHGLHIVSGLALGIDAASHDSALQAKQKGATGSTIAVMGTGIDRIYPQKHTSLAQEIVLHGALVSEFSLGTPPLAAHFPRRNRIISGMSLGVLVVEASMRSGSLITARYALDANREVFAIPGHIANPMAKGCHTLIKEGAMLVDDPDDIMESLAISLPSKQITKQTTKHNCALALQALPPLSPDVRMVLDAMGFAEINVDTLCAVHNISVSKVNSALVELEMEGLVQSTPNGYIRVVQPKRHIKNK